MKHLHTFENFVNEDPALVESYWDQNSFVPQSHRHNSPRVNKAVEPLTNWFDDAMRTKKMDREELEVLAELIFNYTQAIRLDVSLHVGER